MRKQHTLDETGKQFTRGPVERSTYGLRMTLFDAIDDARARTITPQEAGAIGMLVHKVAQNTLLELKIVQVAAALGVQTQHLLPKSGVQLNGGATDSGDAEAPAEPLVGK